MKNIEINRCGSKIKLKKNGDIIINTKKDLIINGKDKVVKGVVYSAIK